MKKMLLLVAALLLVTACATTQPAPSSTPIPTTKVPPTQLPEPTNTSIPPIEVTFDGTGCTVTGPTEVPAGRQTIFFIDQRDIDSDLHYQPLYFDDGKTTQDLLNAQSEPGAWLPRPPWVHTAGRSSSDKLVESNAGRVESTTWNLLMVGEHALVCIDTFKIFWIAGTFMVVEAPSE